MSVPLMKRIFDEDLPYWRHKKLYDKVGAALENFFLSHEIQYDDRFKDKELAYSLNEFENAPVQLFRYNDYRGWRVGGTRYEKHMNRQYSRWSTQRSVGHNGLEGGSALWYHHGKKWMRENEKE